MLQYIFNIFLKNIFFPSPECTQRTFSKHTTEKLLLKTASIDKTYTSYILDLGSKLDD